MFDFEENKRLSVGNAQYPDSPVDNPKGVVKIMRGRVESVDPVQCTLIASVFPEGEYRHIPWASLYAHADSGEGTYAVPEVGAYGYVLVPSDEGQAIFFGFQFPLSEGEWFRSGRPKNMQPGDQFMLGRDGNGIIVRRGGVTRIKSTDLCQRIMQPINNTIRDFCENYQMYSGGGTVTWMVDKADEYKTVYELRAKTKSTEAPRVQVAVGSLSKYADDNEVPPIQDDQGNDVSGEEVYCVIRIRDIEQGPDNDAGRPTYTIGETKIEMKIDKEGNYWIKGNELHEVWTKKVVTCDDIKLGDSQAEQQAVFGNRLVEILVDAFNVFIGAPTVDLEGDIAANTPVQVADAGNLGAPILIAVKLQQDLAAVVTQLEEILSDKVRIS